MEKWEVLIMEGVKILSEEMIKIFGGNTLFPFLIFLGILILIFGICLISYYGFVEVASIVEILIGVMLVTISIIGSVGNTYYEKNIKVTPIEDKYFIDATKYKVVKVEGEIIYLEDNNKYNEKGEIIE